MYGEGREKGGRSRSKRRRRRRRKRRRKWRRKRRSRRKKKSGGGRRRKKKGENRGMPVKLAINKLIEILIIHKLKNNKLSKQ